jgi:hypothetical protein
MRELDRESILYIRYLETAVRDLLPWAEAGSRVYYRTNAAAREMWERIYDGYFDSLLGEDLETNIEREDGDYNGR